jgi:hypothetical protein
MSEATTMAESFKWILYLYPGDKSGEIWYVTAQYSLHKKLDGRFARLIFLLNKAFVGDATLPAHLRGFRSAEDLAKAIAEDPFAYAVDPGTVTTYLSQLRRDLQTPCERGQILPQLVQRPRGCGVRLLCEVEIQRIGQPMPAVIPPTSPIGLNAPPASRDMPLIQPPRPAAVKRPAKRPVKRQAKPPVRSGDDSA